MRDLCLRIDEGECFGFLGVNGAGKSTTFSMLTGATAPTSGDGTLAGRSIRTEQHVIRRELGYCPQHDALEALMTGRETLRMYARIKGVPRGAIEAEVDALIAEVDLVRHADKPAGTYSGGNKRKLCVALALVGSPQLVLLDEPSSGMDAASKRFLWSVIKRRTLSCSTVLTTHSMEECGGALLAHRRHGRWLNALSWSHPVAQVTLWPRLQTGSEAGGGRRRRGRC